MDELHLQCISRQPDIVCIVATWLDGTILDKELSLPGYKIYGWDRNRHSGGIAIYVHTSLTCEIVLEGGPHNLEFLSLSISSHLFFVLFCILLFHCPPSSLTCIFDNLCATLHLVDPAKFSNFLLLGDFNVNFFSSSHPLLSYVYDILYSFSLTQIVPSHTKPEGSKQSGRVLSSVNRP